MTELTPTNALASGIVPIDNVADDTLSGSQKIAGYIGKTSRQTQYLLENKQLPAFKIGGIWHMRKSTYCTFLTRLETEAMKSAALV
jgi:hypothetical protein